MMKTHPRLLWSYSLVLFLLLGINAIAQNQLNLSLKGNLTYTSGANDIWGYVDSLQNEYALVGLEDGVSIVDVTIGNQPVEKIRIPGPLTVWRDLKTWGHYAYVTHDILPIGSIQEPVGLLIIDLDSLSTPRYKEEKLQIVESTFYDSLQTAHNLYIDENGICYIFGSNVKKGGALMFDLKPDPWNPTYVGIFDDEYLHDGMVRGDTLWGGAIYAGQFMAVDVSNKSNPTVLGSGYTPDIFTHNCWISDDGQTLYTTDERVNASIGSYDVSNLPQVFYRDAIKRLPGTGAVPHNVHVLGDFLITSYYTTGVQIVSAQDPNNLVEMGYYDTYPLNDNPDFNGCWGAYPYLPSGVVLASDRSNGLFVLDPTYLDPSFIDGIVLDSVTSAPLNNPEIIHNVDADTLVGDLLGFFVIGQNYTGWDTLRVSKLGYQTRDYPFYYENGKRKQTTIKLLPLGFSQDEWDKAYGFNLYPNPAKEDFRIEWPTQVLNEEAEISIFKSDGSLVSNTQIELSQNQLFNSPKEPGVYFVRVTSNEIQFKTIRLLIL